MNILITSASRKVSLVRAFQSALLRSGGGKVVAVDASPQSPALYVADRHFVVLPSTDAGFIDELLRICDREQVTLVIPTRDEELKIFAESRQRFEAQAIRVMVPCLETVHLCQDKSAFVQFCRVHHFGIPQTYDPKTLRNSDFPLFMKPRLGKGGNGARRVEREEEMLFVMQDPEKWIVQEYVDWTEYTIDLLADFNGRVLSVVPRSRELILAGESYVSRTLDVPHLLAESCRLATELHLIGPSTIQCFWNGKQAKFIEVNPRFGGAAALGWAAGVDTPLMLVRMMKGESVTPRIGQFDPDLIMLRFTDDLFMKSSALLSTDTPLNSITPTPSTDNKTKLQAVLFDLDNTLYPEEQFVMSGFRAVSQFLARQFDLPAESLFEQMRSSVTTHGRGKVFNALLESTNVDCQKWLPTLLQVYRSHQPILTLFPKAKVLLQSLKNRGIRLGLVTDGLASVQRRKIAALGIDSYMDAIVCTGELGRHCAKPSPIPFEVALNLLDVTSQSAVYIADDESKDFVAPNRLGMKSVQIRSGGLLGVRKTISTADPLFKAEITAESLTEALTLLGLL